MGASRLVMIAAGFEVSRGWVYVILAPSLSLSIFPSPIPLALNARQDAVVAAVEVRISGAGWAAAFVLVPEIGLGVELEPVQEAAEGVVVARLRAGVGGLEAEAEAAGAAASR